MSKLVLTTITTIASFLLDWIGRNIFRSGRKHIAGHRMFDGAVVFSRIKRSDSFRRRYIGRHNYNIWKQCYGPGALNSTTTA